MKKNLLYAKNVKIMMFITTIRCFSNHIRKHCWIRWRHAFRCVGKLKSVTPPLKDWKAHSDLEKRMLNLHRLFHFGAEQTPFESSIEKRYLLAKFSKLMDYQRTASAAAQCVWSSKNTQRLQNLANFQNRNLSYFDDFCPIIAVT